jgi:hypothetical protein
MKPPAPSCDRSKAFISEAIADEALRLIRGRGLPSPRATWATALVNQLTYVTVDKSFVRESDRASLIPYAWSASLKKDCQAQGRVDAVLCSSPYCTTRSMDQRPSPLQGESNDKVIRSLLAAASVVAVLECRRGRSPVRHTGASSLISHDARGQCCAKLRRFQ